LKLSLLFRNLASSRPRRINFSCSVAIVSLSISTCCACICRTCMSSWAWAWFIRVIMFMGTSSFSPAGAIASRAVTVAVVAVVAAAARTWRWLGGAMSAAYPPVVVLDAPVSMVSLLRRSEDARAALTTGELAIGDGAARPAS
jgi:hypothetical protein